MVVKFHMHQRVNIAAMAACALLCIFSNAHAEPVREQQVKAAIFINLARFIEWPPATENSAENSDARPFTICIPAGDKMKPALLALSKKSIQGRDLKIHSLRAPSQITDACRTLYISKENDWRLDLADIAGKGILTVGDDEAFLKHGGGILICRHGAKLGFAINRSALRSARLRPSSRILNLAAEVY